jgi:hypothetical protein
MKLHVFFYSVLDCFILEGSCYQLLKSILKVVYHFIGIYNIVSVIHHNTQQSVMDSQDYYTATQEQLLQELVYPGTNISTIPITILYTRKK